MLNCKIYFRYDKLKKGGRTILQISTTFKISGNPSWTASPVLSCKDTVLKKTASASKEIWINTHASSAVHTAAIPRCVLHNGKRMQTDADGEKTEKAKPAGYTGNVHARIHPPSKNIYRDARTEAGIAANVHTQDSDVQKVKKYIQTPEKPTIIHYAFQVPSCVPGPKQGGILPSNFTHLTAKTAIDSLLRTSRKASWSVLNRSAVFRTFTVCDANSI